MGNVLSTKADTLAILYGKLTKAVVLPQISFTYGEWKSRQEELLEKCLEKQAEWGSVIVRSSALDEDSSESSMAGEFDSVANVCGREALKDAIVHVFETYHDQNLCNQVLIQPMLQSVKLCGVAFTLEPNSGSDYYVINYDESGSTSSITSGDGQTGKLYYCVKYSEINEESKEIRTLIGALKELEFFFDQENLDVEFAFDFDGQLYILQVRPLVLKQKKADKEVLPNALKRIENKIKRDQNRKAYLCGDTTIYSVMTDWNPAEMIGIKPRNLAMSLYKELITDNVWAYQRDNYGYRNLRSFPLMVDFAGMPYIDVRVSFNSFVPAELSEELSEKLVNYYLKRIKEEPQKHDKAEFDIVFSCYTFDLPERIKVLEQYGFSKSEIEQIVEALRNVTNQVIDHDNGLYKKDAEKILTLHEHYNTVMSSGMDNQEKIYWLIEDCKRYGTLPFAGLARGAFIAVQILKSMVAKGILSTEDYDAFMNENETVSKKMSIDFKNMSKDDFLKEYGHLRPGTYDINSLRYDEAPDLYFNWDKKEEREPVSKEGFRMSLVQMNQLKKEIEGAGLCCDILELMDYIRTVIEGREYGKFVFTRSLSMVLKLLEELGREYGLSRDDISYADIKTIQAAYSTTRELQSILKASVEQGKKIEEISKIITLPPVILESDDIYRFYYPDSEPNYITVGEVTGKIVKEREVSETDIRGKIVMIKSADPGYDWIFSKGISGFITMYGGANSHMAIRAGELGIPAVIGVGQKLYDKVSEAALVKIECGNKLIRILS